MFSYIRFLRFIEVVLEIVTKCIQASCSSSSLDTESLLIVFIYFYKTIFIFSY